MNGDAKRNRYVWSPGFPEVFIDTSLLVLFDQAIHRNQYISKIRPHPTPGNVCCGQHFPVADGGRAEIDYDVVVYGGSGRVILVDRRTEVGVDLPESVAAKNALQEAAAQLTDRLVSALVNAYN